MLATLPAYLVLGLLIVIALFATIPEGTISTMAQIPLARFAMATSVAAL